MSRAIIIVFASLLISACVVTPPAPSPFEIVKETKLKVVEMPHVDSEARGYLGEALLYKIISSTGPGFAVASGATTIYEEGTSCVVFQSFKFLTDASGFIERKYVSDDPLTNEDLLCSEPLKDAEVNVVSEPDVANPYLSNQMICKDLIDGRFYYVSPVVAPKSCGGGGDWKLLRYGVFPQGSIKEVTKEVPGETNLKLELIYNGRVGDAVKFIYREFQGDLARPSFTQEVQYDLSISSTIGFKEARLEVIEATNTEIRYTVKQHFRGL